MWVSSQSQLLVSTTCLDKVKDSDRMKKENDTFHIIIQLHLTTGFPPPFLLSTPLFSASSLFSRHAGKQLGTGDPLACYRSDAMLVVNDTSLCILRSCCSAAKKKHLLSPPLMSGQEWGYRSVNPWNVVAIPSSWALYSGGQQNYGELHRKDGGIDYLLAATLNDYME